MDYMLQCQNLPFTTRQTSFIFDANIPLDFLANFPLDVIAFFRKFFVLNILAYQFNHFFTFFLLDYLAFWGKLSTNFSWHNLLNFFANSPWHCTATKAKLMNINQIN